jgi:hypothetical protein
MSDPFRLIETKLGANDIVVFYVAVGDMPADILVKHVTDLMLNLKRIFQNNELIVLPIRTGQTEITIIHVD